MESFPPTERLSLPGAWRRYAFAILAIFFGLLAAAEIFILLIDPFGVSPISLPLDRALVTVQRYMYPQVIRSHKFDSAIFGTSTSMSLDPEELNGPFQARFANIAMASATAWEQKTLIELFLREVPQPKVIVIGLDTAWCLPSATKYRITFRGFPDWLYDDNPWNDYLNLLNRISFMSAIRLLRFNFGMYSPTTRFDGLDAFLPPDAEYDVERARRHIYSDIYGGQRQPERESLEVPANAPLLPAMPWLEEILSEIPGQTAKVLAFMPVHVRTRSPDAQLDLCKARVSEIGQQFGATVIDWRIPSSITLEDSNYWDSLHYRVSVAKKIAHDLSAAFLTKKPSIDGTYQVLSR